MTFEKERTQNSQEEIFPGIVQEMYGVVNRMGLG